MCDGVIITFAFKKKTSGRQCLSPPLASMNRLLCFLFSSLLCHPRHSSLDSQGLLHTLSSLSHPRPRLLLVLLSPVSSHLALYAYTFPLRPLSLTSSDTPEHRTPLIYESSLDLPWISPSSHGHPSPGLSLLPFSCFPCPTFISAPLLLSHLVSPYLTSIFDPLYYH